MIKPLLRFRHIKGDQFSIDSRWNVEKAIRHMLETQNYERSFLDSVDFWGSISVPIIQQKSVYIKTTASLFLENGDFLVETTAYKHPDDQFCRRTGRFVAQQKIIDILRFDSLNLDSQTRRTLLQKLTHNSTAQPLNW